MRFLLRRYGEYRSAARSSHARRGCCAGRGIVASGTRVIADGIGDSKCLRQASAPGAARADILERIKTARDEGRQAEADEKSWWEDVHGEARRNTLRLHEREAEWERIQREVEAERKRRHNR